VGINRIVLSLAAVDGFQVECVPEHERSLLTSAEVSEPVPGQHTLDGHDDIGAIWRNRPEECRWTGLRVLVEQDLLSLIQDADSPCCGHADRCRHTRGTAWCRIA